jgi:hypothetical protein
VHCGTRASRTRRCCTKYAEVLSPPSSLGIQSRHPHDEDAGENNANVTSTPKLSRMRHCAQTGEIARASQHGLSVCIGGHTTVPYEQKTQQWPANGRSKMWQPVHS